MSVLLVEVRMIMPRSSESRSDTASSGSGGVGVIVPVVVVGVKVIMPVMVVGLRVVMVIVVMVAAMVVNGVRGWVRVWVWVQWGLGSARGVVLWG